jgi:hypothetical protein
MHLVYLVVFLSLQCLLKSWKNNFWNCQEFITFAVASNIAYLKQTMYIHHFKLSQSPALLSSIDDIYLFQSFCL